MPPRPFSPPSRCFAVCNLRLAALLVRFSFIAGCPSHVGAAGENPKAKTVPGGARGSLDLHNGGIGSMRFVSAGRQVAAASRGGNAPLGRESARATCGERRWRRLSAWQLLFLHSRGWQQLPPKRRPFGRRVDCQI